MIDSIFLITVGLCGLLGYKKGILRTALGPFSLIILTTISLLYYKLTGNLLTAIILGVIGPFVFHIFLIVLLQILGIVNLKEKKLTLQSRLCGSAFGIIWTGFILIVSIITIVFLPIASPKIQSIQNKIFKSRVYKISNAALNNQLPSTLKKEFDPTDQEQVKKLQNSDEFKTLQENKIYQDFMNDPLSQQQLQDRDYAALLSNPKMKKILEDPELIKQFISLHKTLGEKE